jgi:chaperonin GroES
MTLKPLGNRLVVELIKRSNTTTSGIIVSTKEENEQSQGRIISIASGADIDSEINISTLGLQVGDVVLFGKYAGEDVTADLNSDTAYKILNAKDILALIQN